MAGTTPGSHIGSSGSSGYIPPAVSIVTENEDGYLACAFHTDQVWCDHIQEHMRHHRDVEEFWKEKIQDAPTFGSINCHMRLPIIPSEDLWANVIISCNDKNVWQLVLQKPVGDPAQYQPVPIGITGPSEARAAWRMMIIDFWRAQCDAQFPKCESKGHSFKAQVQWTQALELDTTHIEYHRNAWTAWYHKLCWHCYEIRKGYNLTPEDLVPDDDRAVSKFYGLGRAARPDNRGGHIHRGN